jgi:drug/metabolite transporter (DMT)-like permease
MNVAMATSCALGAAALFAVATAVQSKAVRDVERHRTAEKSRGSQETTTPQAWRVVTAAIASGTWLAGGAIAVAAFGLHALALHEGNLTLVQPLLVTMVLFALPVSHAFGGPPVTLPELGWAIILVVGLAAFFAAADPVSPSGSGVDLWPAIITSSLAVLAIGLCVQLARRRSAGQAAALLGAGAGIAFAGVAALVKGATNVLGHGVGALLSGWQLYSLVVVGAIGIVLSQLAYRAGPLSASVPAMNGINPLASVLIGVAVFDEHFRTGAIDTTAETIALAVMTLATVLLSRLPRADTSPVARPARRSP